MSSCPMCPQMPEEVCIVCMQPLSMCRAMSTEPDCRLPVPNHMDYLTRRIREHAGCHIFNSIREDMKAGAKAGGGCADASG